MAISIHVKNLSKKLVATQALNQVSTVFQQGPMHGVIGPEGAGKTTLFRHLVGLLKADAGELLYLDEGQVVPFATVRPRIAYMPQQQSLYADLSIDEHLRFFQSLYSLDEATFQEKRRRLLEMTRLSSFVDRPAGQLSGGMYKKLGLMCALMASPRVLLLDEPTNGVDPISRREFWDLLYQLCAEDILIIVSTAYMDEAERCGEVHVLNEGHLLGAGEPRALLKAAGAANFDSYFLQRSENTEVIS